jgi:hypothetical protein
MFSKPLLTAVAVALLARAIVASPPPQEPQGGGGRENAGAPSVPQGALTPYGRFAGPLKLDKKAQAPAVQQTLADAQKEAAPVGQQMLQLRQQLVNAALANKAEETKAALTAYTAAAATMAGIEARAFAKVYAMLEPDQQSRAPQAFALMAGLFQPTTPRAGGRSGQRGGGER